MPRDKIFISYSHLDPEWLRRFRTHLSSLFEVKSARFIWEDHQIQAGDDWFKKIKTGIAESCVAVLLVTPDFMDSDFITNHELPLLQAAHQAERLKILWLPVKTVAGYGILKGLQALVDPKEPVAELAVVRQDPALAKAAIEVKTQYDRMTGSARQDDPLDSNRELTLLRKFEVRPTDDGPCAIDANGQFWITEERWIKRLHPGSAVPKGREAFPAGKKSWKAYADFVWRGKVLLGDWDGGIYCLDGDTQTREAPLYSPTPADLPAHCFAAGRGGHLYAASWDGKIRRWEPSGEISGGGWPIVLPSLPTRLAALADGSLAVADQHQDVRLYGPQGSGVWQWPSPDRVERLWALSANPTAVAAQIGDRRIVQLVNSHVQNSLVFKGPIRALAHGHSITETEMCIVASGDGRIDWISLSHFDKVEGRDTGVALRQLLIVPNHVDTVRNLAVGLTEDGCLIAIQDTAITHYAAPRGIRRMACDPSGRYLYLVFDSAVEAYVNPLVPRDLCRISLAVDIDDSLKVNAYRTLRVPLRNSGMVSIARVQADLESDQLDVPHRTASFDTPIAPGKEFQLSFSVRARFGGALPLKLNGRLFDESGSASPFELTFFVQAEE